MGKEAEKTPYAPAWSSLGESDRRARGAGEPQQVETGRARDRSRAW